MILPLDGPAAQLALSVTISTVQEAKAAGSVLAERKAITLQPTNGDLYVYFADAIGATPSAATMQANGLIMYEGEKGTYEASDTQKVFILAVNTTTNVIVVERA